MGQRGVLASNFGLRNGLRKCEKIERPLKDCISELPNEILVHILSFLTLKESARTSVVSKRWIDLWLYVNQLDFDGSKILDKLAAIADTSKHSSSRRSERCKFVKWVDKVLQSHNALALDEFRVCFDLDNSSQNKIDKWLRYAFARKVQRLELDLLEYGEILCSFTKAYTISFGSLGLSSGKTSEKSHSGCCGSHPCASIDFKSLRTLSLTSVNVAGEVIEFFLQKCPFLERLVVQGSHDLTSLEVCGPSLALQHLEITYCYRLRSLTVHNTNLVSLKITEAQTLMLANVPKLVNIYISGRSTDLVRDVISWLSCCLLKLEVLTVHASLFQGNAKLRELPQLTKLKHLTLVTQVSEDVSLIGFTSLIRASPNLEKFVLKLQWNYDIVRGNRKSEKALSVPLQHLKVVELSGYYGRQSDLELVKYFVENEVSLEKIIVDPRNQPVFRCHRVQTSREIRKEQDARDYAKQQLEGLIPSHIKLVIC